MSATAKPIQRLEPSSAITCHPIPDFAALMLITRFAPYRPESHYMRGGPGPKRHARNDPCTPSHGVRGRLKDVNRRRLTSNH
jgi:hypothetical protein